MRLTINRKDVHFYPDTKRVITRFIQFPYERNLSIIQRILKIPDDEVNMYFRQNLREFAKRHRNITRILFNNFLKVKNIVANDLNLDDISDSRKHLIGSYFTMEYSIESAAIFNPSIIEDPDQSGLEEGDVRVIVSLRATGESHISSIVFRSGVIDKNNNFTFSPRGNYIGEAEIIKDHIYDKEEFGCLMKEHNVNGVLADFILKSLDENFTYHQLKEKINSIKENASLDLDKKKILKQMLWLAKSHYEISFSEDTDISERVIFPISSSEKNGIEDARFVKFCDDNGEISYYATYTAYDGFTILPTLLETKDFYYFKNIPLHGEFARDKNFALFPRKINGKYAMLSRVDGENHYIMFSDSITWWDNGQLLLEPQNYWELIQMGNCGSPIETEKGWLVITHGVGQMRKYSIGAILLDLDDPTKVIGSLKDPLLVPNENEREGYVPNVVYTCGAMCHNNELILPYAVSDYGTSFATINLDMLMNELLK